MSSTPHVETFVGHAGAFDDALRLRIEVFVDEQGVPAEEEPDAIDAEAFHVLVRDDAGRAVATGRLYTDPENARGVRLGRFAVARRVRGTGLGSVVMEELLDEARRRGARTAMLSSQTQALPFYEAHGFAAHGPEYDDAGIPHRTMTRDLG